MSIIEIHHGKPENILSAMSKLSSVGKTPDDYAFMGKMRKYALVSDNPSILIRLMVSFARAGKVQMRIFPMHERDQARQWIEQRIEEAAADYAPVAKER